MIENLKRNFPFVAAAAVLLLLLLFRSEIIGFNLSNRISLDGLYTAIFDWSAIQTGFLFGVFGFVAGKKDGFLAAIAQTPVIDEFIWSLKKAIVVGFVLTITSMPMIVYPLNPSAFGFEYVLLCIWFSLFIWAFMLFCLVAYTFGVIVRVPDNRDRLAH